MTRERLIIVGNGMAGGKLVEELLAHSPDRFDITVIGDEPVGNYNRIKLALRLKEELPQDFFLNTPEWYAENGVKAILGHPVVEIWRGTKTVSLEDGTVLPYDKLVLATGSRPFIPPLNGSELQGTFALRCLEDVEKVRHYIRDKSQVMVVGGGLLGLELALALRLLGKRVTVSHLMPTLMELQLPEEAGRFLKRHLEKLHIHFIMGTYITDLIGTTAGVEKAVFKDGTTCQTDAVFFNCGIRPNVDLARAAGLICSKGVTVNERLQTSDADIYACGECLEFRGETWGLVAPVYEQARVLASILHGSLDVYVPSPPSPTHLKSDIPAISMGRFKPTADDEVTLFTEPATGIYKQLISRDSILQGAVLVGEDLNVDMISLHYTAKMPLPARQADLLFPGARAGDDIVDGTMIPDEARICDCQGVSALKVRQSIRQGNDTLYKVMLNTKAGTGCGNCKNKLKALLIAEVGELRVDPAEKYYVAGVPMDREELSKFIGSRNLRSVSAVLAAVPDSVDDFQTRMGLDFLLNYLWKSDYTVENDSRSANDRHSGNIQNDGRYSVIPNIPGGIATSRQLRAIAGVADRYNAMIKVTGANRIGLYSIEKSDLPRVWDELQMGSGHAYTKSFRACKSCVGSTHCRFGLMDSLALGHRMGERYRGVVGPAKMKMGVSGCPRNCSEATIKDIGIVAVEGGWDVYFGGNGGAQVYVAHKVAQVKTDDEVIRIADRFYEYYRRHARYGERTAPFMERLGISPVVDAVLNAPQEDLMELEHSFQAALDNYRDPWDTPVESTQAEHPDFGARSDDGYVSVARIEDIPAGSSHAYTVDDEPIAIFHGRDGRWVATHGVCPHEQGPMVDGIYGNGRLVCPLHSYAFSVDTGVCDTPDIDPLKIYPITTRAGQVWVKT